MRAAIAVLILALATTGCATMFNDGGPVMVTSQRPAQLLEGSEVIGSAPGEITETGLIEARAEGCEPHTQRVSRSISGWFFANLLTGVFPLTMAIDAITGNMWNYSPSQFHVPCQPVTGG